ncbi:SMP-30/gluconolactonase/LRE family protein [Ruficoccus amylovorans]|uniref:SMP-30/gluconolactonase/LRE family protein n=1 Tax=Ruficoccus amylovorans TaxID=1804625 RepID=A0A842HFV0_9BACT|nr:SMP-30/gluconolactonase/LRE family protein [Ruficoccus amylovorans]MBC2595282.1 SMP-30/gluconolactonase/LRE family protein [Ruficoccus amylovorans]
MTSKTVVNRYLSTLALFIACLSVQGQPADFPPPPESTERAPGVVAGESIDFELNDSEVFPGTQRMIGVYVPRAYDGQTPACVAVFQDKLQFNFDTVFDNLISTGEMPVTIGVIVPPGKIPGTIEPGWRHNRTFEYDSPGDRYATFILEEVLPAVEKQTTSDGRPIRLSSSGNDRMIGGGSSGAAAAFNAAWARPEEFSRVFSAIGSYTGLRGSYAYPTLIHKTEPKPLRLFLQSGTNDMWTAFGDWWSANNAMVRALAFADYDFEYEFGEGKHSPSHGTALFPRAMRYLWKDWPQPVQPGMKSRNHLLKQTLWPNVRWTQLPGDFPGATLVRADEVGNIFVSTPQGIVRCDENGKSLAKMGDGVFRTVDSDKTSWLRTQGDGTVERVSPDGKTVREILARDLPVQALVESRSGDVYAAASGKLWLLRAGHEPQVVDEGPVNIGGLAITGDGNWLAAFEADTTRGFSYALQPDGKLEYKQTFYVLHKADADDSAEVRDAAAETSKFGYVYVATDLGVQICDANGRSGAIVPLPDGVAAVSLCFGGRDFKTLYVLGVDGHLYSRPAKNSGAAPFRPAVKIEARAG